MPLELGSVIPFQFTVTDATGALVNASTISATVNLPDGTTVVRTPTNVGTGTYNLDEPATMVGTWWAVATTTSPNDVSPAQSFYVDATSETVTFVSLADAVEHLRVTNSSNHEQVRRHLIAATKAVEDYTGRKWRRTTITDERHDGGRTALILRASPVQSVTSVAENGTAVASGNWFLRSDAPIVVRGSTTGPIDWAPGEQNIAVTYVAGPPGGLVPWAVRQGCLEWCRSMFEAQRGGGSLPEGAEFMDISVTSASAIPREVETLLQPYGRPGIR